MCTQGSSPSSCPAQLLEATLQRPHKGGTFKLVVPSCATEAWDKKRDRGSIHQLQILSHRGQSPWASAAAWWLSLGRISASRPPLGAVRCGQAFLRGDLGPCSVPALLQAVRCQGWAARSCLWQHMHRAPLLSLPCPPVAAISAACAETPCGCQSQSYTSAEHLHTSLAADPVRTLHRQLSWCLALCLLCSPS